MVEKIADKNDAGKRFDVVARAAFPALALSQIFRAIRTGSLKLNHKKAKMQQRISAGDILQYFNTYSEEESPDPMFIADVDLKGCSDIEIIWQNDDLIALNKPRGMKVHDGADSLQSWLWGQIGKGHALSFTPSPCHRLDRNTSGLVIFAKTAQGAREFAQRQESQSLKKVYLGILTGSLRKHTYWENILSYSDGKAFISESGRIALTEVEPIAWNIQETLVALYLHTGRTHQIRVQAKEAGLPLSGDTKYGGAGNKYYLHAICISDQNKNPLFPSLWSNIPQDFSKRIDSFGTSTHQIRKKVLMRAN